MNPPLEERPPTIMEVDDPDPLELRGAPPLLPNHPSVFIDWDDETMDAVEATSSPNPGHHEPYLPTGQFRDTFYVHDSWRFRRHL